MEQQLTTHLQDDSDNFYFMINPYFPTKKMLRELSKNLPHLVRYYSSYQKVIADKIKKLENIDLPLVAVNGSCEAIKIFLQNFSKNALVTVPNFNEWEISNHINIPYNASTEEIRNALKNNLEIDTACFCNPNNPTGYYREDLQTLAQEFPQVRFAIDVSFIDFVANEIPPLPTGKNIILVKSLGKNYGICGLRLGYIASEDEQLISEINKRTPIWNINSINEFMIDRIIENKTDYEKSRRKIIAGTKKMAKLLKTFDFLEVYPTKANFILVKSQKPLTFNVKNCGNKSGIDNTHYRFAYNKNYQKLKELLR